MSLSLELLGPAMGALQHSLQRFGAYSAAYRGLLRSNGKALTHHQAEATKEQPQRIVCDGQSQYRCRNSKAHQQVSLEAQVAERRAEAVDYPGQVAGPWPGHR